MVITRTDSLQSISRQESDLTGFGKMISQYDAGALNFEPANINLLREQAAIMGKYLAVFPVDL